MVTSHVGHQEIVEKDAFRDYIETNKLSGLSFHEKYVEHLIRQGYKIVMIVPPNLLTHFAGSKKPAELATIREFNYLMRNLDRTLEGQVLVVSE